MEKEIFVMDSHSMRDKKDYLEKRDLITLNWTSSMINIIYLQNSVTRHFSLLTEELIAETEGREFRNYGHHPVIQRFFERIFADCLVEVRKSSHFLITKIDELLANVYTVMQHHNEPGIRENDQFLDELFRLVSQNTELMMFVQANVQTIKAVFNSRLVAFERVTYRDFYKYVLEKKEECFKAFLLHPPLIMIYFLCNKIYQSIPTALIEAERRREQNQKSPELKKFAEAGSDQIIISINPEDSPSPSGIFTDTGKLLALQEDFFKNRKNTLLENLEIPPEEYFNIGYYSTKSESILSNNNLTLDQFIDQSKHYPRQTHSKAEVILKNPTYNLLDLWLVFLHTFLFIMNIYGLAMTSYLYARSLKLDSSISGVIQACTPGGSFIFGFWVNYWTLSNRYKIPYITVLTLLLIGNFLYFLAETYSETNSTKALVILVIARVLIGLGGARLMTRKYIAINVQVWALTKYSAVLTGITAVGMCFGPGISALIELAKPSMLGDAKLEIYNIFAFMYIFIWSAMIFLFLFCFKGYDKTKDEMKEFKTLNTPSQAEQVLQIEQFEVQQNLSQIIEISENPQLLNDSKLPHNNQRLIPQDSANILWIYHPDKMTLFALVCFFLIKVC